jgi:beta-lactamase class A
MFVTSFAFCLALVAAVPAFAQQVDEIASTALAELPGKTAFLFTEITENGPKPVFELRADERFAVGSSFKLFILGELIEEVNEGRRRPDDSMLLRADRIGPPASELAAWPIGSPITLHTLALKMISISDNTATDHLLYLLGREQVEARMQAMGHGAAQLNRPLLSTREMTMLRDKAEKMPGRAYQKLNEQDRRQFLGSKLAAVPDYEKLEFDTTAYDLAEWYASPTDMAHALDWIYRHTTPGHPAALMRGILAVDPKLPQDRAIWPFVGFKGGSEDQLLAGNWLLEHRNGRWYSFHVFCNSPREKVEPQQLMKATAAIFAAIEKSLGDEGPKK